MLCMVLYNRMAVTFKDTYELMKPQGCSGTEGLNVFDGRAVKREDELLPK